MGKITQILQTAQQRAKDNKLPYEGALLPREAYELLCDAPAAKLVDVRSRAEWELIGTIPASILIEWQAYPGWHANPYFLQQLAGQVDPECLVMFICRSGGRSHHAAAAASQAGFNDCYNVLEGFEGDRDKTTSQRGRLNGWQAAELPWSQS